MDLERPDTPQQPRPARIQPEAFLALLDRTIPMSRAFALSVPLLERGRAVVRLAWDDTMVRAGGTASGPTLMTLADTALYAAVLSELGDEPLAVTSDLHIRFLRRPKPADLVADAWLHKTGRLLVGTVQIHSAGDEAGGPVAHVTGTYVAPPRRRHREDAP